MVDFTLQGLEHPVSLPDEYLTVKQWEDCLRYFTKQGVDEIDFNDLAVMRAITSLIISDDVDLAGVPMTPENATTLFSIYNHIAKLIQNAMGVGEEAVEEKIKKEEGVPKKTTRKRKPRQSKNC